MRLLSDGFLDEVKASEMQELQKELKKTKDVERQVQIKAVLAKHVSNPNQW